ncbi:MAG: SDR family NAD(P)-dependent oxidoreductase [Candidatus Binatia bacterium]
MSLKDKVALVTGGGRGVGKAVALAYAHEGVKLVICARTASEIEQSAGEIRQLGTECLGLVCDVSVEDSVATLVKDLEDYFGRVDILVNNAGVMTRPVSLAELEVRKWDYTLAVNLRGTFLVTRTILPLMFRQKNGSIINVSSTIGRGAYANFAAYAVSKWGVEGLTQTLAVEVKSHNIRVNSVDPGTVATKLTGYAGSRPESVTGVFVFLASDESRGITGRMLSSSGWKSQIKQS